MYRKGWADGWLGWWDGWVVGAIPCLCMLHACARVIIRRYITSNWTLSIRVFVFWSWIKLFSFCESARVVRRREYNTTCDDDEDSSICTNMLIAKWWKVLYMTMTANELCLWLTFNRKNCLSFCIVFARHRAETNISLDFETYICCAYLCLFAVAPCRVLHE